MKKIMNKDDEQNNDKKKKRSLLLSLIIAVLGVIFFHLRMGIGPLGVMHFWSINGHWEWGYTVFLVALFFIFFAIAFLFSKGIFKIKKKELNEEEKKQRKGMSAEIIFLIIDFLMTGLFIKLNWEQISTAETMVAIAEVAAFFGIVWLGFELFNRFQLLPKRIFSFIAGFLIKVCAPMLLLIIIMLGAYQAKYSYEDIFRPAIGHSADIFAENMRIAFYNIIISLYDIGQSNPNLWIWLPIAAFVLMTIWLLWDTFTEKEKRDSEKSVQEIIDETLKEEKEKAEEQANKTKPMSYNFFEKIGNALKSKGEKEAELEEKEDDKNAKYKIYDSELIFKGLKGGMKND